MYNYGGFKSGIIVMGIADNWQERLLFCGMDGHSSGTNNGILKRKQCSIILYRGNIESNSDEFRKIPLIVLDYNISHTSYHFLKIEGSLQLFIFIFNLWITKMSKLMLTLSPIKFGWDIIYTTNISNSLRSHLFIFKKY